MDIDYKKVIDFLLPNGIKKNGLDNVLEEILTDYNMSDVNTNAKAILLISKTNKQPYILSKRNAGIMMAPAAYKTLNFTDDFGEVIEIRCNEDNNVVLSCICEKDNPHGVYVSVSIWHNEEEEKYTQVSGRIFFINYDELSRINNKQTIEMFINQYQVKRNDVYCDLYWDMNSLVKSEFINVKNSERIQVNDGYIKEDFKDLYKKYNDKVNSTIKSSMF